METSRGNVNSLLHPIEGGSDAIICVSGASGGLNGPAHNLYTRLPLLLEKSKVTVLRIDYREPNHFAECVLARLEIDELIPNWIVERFSGEEMHSGENIETINQET